MTPVAETIVYAVTALLMSTVGSYVFGAAWHDKNLMETRSERNDIAAVE